MVDHKGKSCIVVDDNEYAQNKLVDLLILHFDFKILAKGKNGEEAIQLYQLHKPDIIFLDLTMPIKDGKMALKEILDLDPKARILIVSAVKDPITILECMRLGAKGWIHKILVRNDPELIEGFKKDVLDALKE